jgi:shikimate dehydrogenase
MQEAAFQAAGIDASYEAVQLKREELPSWVERARSDLAGFNITIPYKESVVEMVDEISVDARLVGAVNTVACRQGTFSGHNTDIDGTWALLDTLDFDVTGRRAVVFGAGGSARAIVAALSARGASITIVNQTVSRAEALIRDLRARTVEMADAGPSQSGDVPQLRAVGSGSREAFKAASEAALLVNATPLGMAHLAYQTPLPDGVSLDHQPVVVDLVYGTQTAFMRRAWQSGCRTIDGIEMLVHQGAAAFRIWTGVTPDLNVMRQACLDALAAR